ncbi:hypothetical protein T261_8590 [Streptomyces lydicus]|nr:hypothetical protein T261_8590 [Streptomyces lydicus]
MRGWQNETHGCFDLHAFPGGYFYLNDQLPQVVQVIHEAVLASRVSPR